MASALRRGSDVTLGFDRPRAQQWFPMFFPRWQRERGRNEENFGTQRRQREILLREAEIVAHAEANLPHRGLGDDERIAALGRFTFQKLWTVGNVDVKQMNFAIDRDDFAFVVDDQVCIRGFVAAVDFFLKAAERKPNPKLLRESAIAFDELALEGAGEFEKVGVFLANERKALG